MVMKRHCDEPPLKRTKSSSPDTFSFVLSGSSTLRPLSEVPFVLKASEKAPPGLSGASSVLVDALDPAMDRTKVFTGLFEALCQGRLDSLETRSRDLHFYLLLFTRFSEEQQSHQRDEGGCKGNSSSMIVEEDASEDIVQELMRPISSGDADRNEAKVKSEGGEVMKREKEWFSALKRLKMVIEYQSSPQNASALFSGVDFAPLQSLHLHSLTLFMFPFRYHEQVSALQIKTALDRIFDHLPATLRVLRIRHYHTIVYVMQRIRFDAGFVPALKELVGLTPLLDANLTSLKHLLSDVRKKMLIRLKDDGMRGSDTLSKTELKQEINNTRHGVDLIHALDGMYRDSQERLRLHQLHRPSCSLADLQTKAEEKEMLDNSVQKNFNQTNCIYFPQCARGVDCKFYHPKPALCPYFPVCRYGDYCVNVHPTSPPLCKYNFFCKKPDCLYSHVTSASVVAPISFHAGPFARNTPRSPHTRHYLHRFSRPRFSKSTTKRIHSHPFYRTPEGLSLHAFYANSFRSVHSRRRISQFDGQPASYSKQVMETQSSRSCPSVLSVVDLTIKNE